MLAFSKQESITPCPIWSVNQFIKQNYSDCVIIGHDEVPESLRATSKNPIVYVRKVNARNIQTTYVMVLLGMDIKENTGNDPLKT